MTALAPTGQQWEQLWFPLWPYASDDLKAGIYRMGRGPALERRYIEANPKALSNLLVVDIDHDDAKYRAMWDRKQWQPNAIVENPANGHAHAVWALQEPVTRTDYGSRKATAYAAAIVEGLRRSVDGDIGYSGLMTKNPTHDAWDAHWISDELYSLPQLHLHLDASGYMPPQSWKRSKGRRSLVGLERNCTIFETARTWAYRELRNHFGDSQGLYLAIKSEVDALNDEFFEPLHASESKAIANSIHKWITTQSRMWKDGPAVYEATFPLIQSARGRKGGVKSGIARRGGQTLEELALAAMEADRK